MLLNTRFCPFEKSYWPTADGQPHGKKRKNIPLRWFFFISSNVFISYPTDLIIKFLNLSSRAIYLLLLWLALATLWNGQGLST
jgi:hypothetical protein